MQKIERAKIAILMVMLAMATPRATLSQSDSTRAEPKFAEPKFAESTFAEPTFDEVVDIDYSQISDAPPTLVSSNPSVSYTDNDGPQVERQPVNWLMLDTPLSYALLDFQNRQTDKELLILQHRTTRPWCHPYVLAGGQARLSLLAAHTTATDKFSYLGRFPTDFQGDTASDARILQANSHITAAATSWATVYAELLFSDVFTFSSFNQGSLQTRQAYAVFGDLKASPWYGYIGKKNIGFGDLSTLSPFTQSVVWHYFGALAEGVGLGYLDHGWNITLAGINGGRGIRVADSVERGKINNFALNLTYSIGEDTDRQLRIGGGYLHGTIYDGFTAEHIDQNQFGEDYNSAWDVNATLALGRLLIAGEYVSTIDAWPVTGERVSAYRVESAYELETQRPSRMSASWSEGIQGEGGSEFEFNRQLVLGYGIYFNRNALGTVEYVRSSGFAPLINITTVSDRDVVQDSLVLGLTLVL